MWVDFHWHARDFERQRYKETVEHSLAVAEAAGLDAIGVMPNTDPALTSFELCQAYLSLVPKNSSVKVFVHVGLTPDLEQVKRAVEAIRLDDRIFGMKAYWGRSTGDLSIVEEDAQFRVMSALAREGYDGVLVGHFEDERIMRDNLYDPKKPVTWSTLCRPEDAEISSFLKILKMAESVNFQGALHVAHVSTAFVVDYVADYKGPVKLSCGVTPHHVFFNNSKLEGPNGGYFKCNPPLRDEQTRKGLEARLVNGRIPIIESDHAPHSHDDKHPPEGKVPASGLVVGTAWPYVINGLRSLGMSESAIHSAAFQNAVRLYGLEGRVEPVNKPDFDRLKELQGFYPFDPFACLKA